MAGYYGQVEGTFVMVPVVEVVFGLETFLRGEGERGRWRERVQEGKQK